MTYFQLRNYGVDGQIGLERTPAAFLDALYAVFDEVRRVMRDDAVLFVNLGDSYAGSGKGPTTSASTLGAGRGVKGHEKVVKHTAQLRQGFHDEHKYTGMPSKSLLLIPERFAIGMADRGWIVRSQIVWAKKSAMPESVKDRPTSAWEPIFMFTKQARYYWDADAVRQPLKEGADHDRDTARTAETTSSKNLLRAEFTHTMRSNPLGGNIRNVWHLSPEPSRDEHYAAYPTEIPRRCILAATSEKGQCPACGAPWRRVVDRSDMPAPGKMGQRYAAGIGESSDLWPSGTPPQSGLRRDVWQRAETTGWEAGCKCDAGDPVPQVVLDCFGGSGTTGVVADRLGRDAILVELNPAYAEMARRRIEGDVPLFASVEVAS